MLIETGVKGLSIIIWKDSVWVNTDATIGKHSSFNLRHFVDSKGPIVRKAILDWCKEISESYSKKTNNKAATHEPQPTPGKEVVLPHVIQDLQDRATEGKKKYGTLLETENGRDALMDAYQEALDLVMYMRQTIMERDKPNLSRAGIDIVDDLDSLSHWIKLNSAYNNGAVPVAFLLDRLNVIIDKYRPEGMLGD